MRPEERETVIQFDDGSDEAHVYTCQRGLAQRLGRLGFKPTQVDRNGKHEVAWHFEVPKTYILVRRPRRVVLTETRREQLRQARAAKQARLATELA